MERLAGYNKKAEAVIMKEVERINKEWGDKFIGALNAQDAAIVFAFGMTKDGKVKICLTTDLTSEQLRGKLLDIINVLGKNG